MRKNEAGIRKEHETIRNAVGYYDFTHQLLEVTGKDAKAFLDYIFVSSIAKAKVGEAKYTTMLNEDGVIIDDVIVFRIDDELYWVSTLYISDMIKWFDVHKEKMDVSYKDITPVTTMYAVQGPKSGAVLNDFLKEKINDMKLFTIKDNMIDNVPVKIARSGYTGELGYEIYCKPDDKALVESKLEDYGVKYGISIIATDVIITSLPREKGYVLMSDLAGTNPLEVGFDWTVSWDKKFLGKAALEIVKAQGPKHSLLGFTVDDDAAVIETKEQVKINGEVVGKVTTFTYGYTIEKNLGFALIENAKAKVGDQVIIGKYTAILTDRIFYDVDNARVRNK
ncbi:MAG: glycine cleavage system protein T [Acetobacterium sp. MES1]|uniref:aminomethyltransferase family protein n=1 Tax=Acetobacterium sp. MES1 TaxID=1899015 RepID=UPI000B9C886A|nr:aminomethyltransferase family protein [Acetobacterium sp. MES1]OXS27199.1 MAG: glycine cleavage system protein T [Acetobacterium sp. MES1]